MTVSLEGGCRVSQMHDGKPLIAGTLRLWPQIGRATGAQAISLSVMEFGTGRSSTIRNDDCDQILYLLDTDSESASNSGDEVTTAHGSGSVTIVIDGQSFKIAANTGIYISPHQSFAIDNAGSAAVTMISSQCPDPDRSPKFDGSATVSVAALASQDACAPVLAQPVDTIPIVRLSDQKAQPTADRWYRVLIDERVGSTQVTQFVGAIPPGRAPDHFHHYEEVLFILNGEGRMWAGETSTPISRGSCIYLPKGQIHCVENTGAGELRLLGVFYPAGSPSVRYET
jgi:mannose-6-phosphate isomerase-like protein (cupin superfamily)